MKLNECSECRHRHSVKRLLSLILSLCVLFNITAGLDYSAYSATLASSGSCGANVTYTFDSSIGKLVISGTGAMTNYSSSSSPFSSTSTIKTVIINSGVTSIGSYAFYYCSGLTSVTIPNSVTSIGTYAFCCCEGLTSITIPDSVTSIGSSAFSNCTGLTSITIPDSVTSIGEGAFVYCTSLTSITIPDSVTSIGNYAFSYCRGLTRINVDSANKSYTSVDGVLFNKDKTTLIRYPIGNSRTTYTIPNSVTSIGDCAFSSCKGLTNVTIPDSVMSIGDSAFLNCTSLTSVTIPNSVTSIGDWAFCNCTGLTSITIPDSVTSIGNYAFDHCNGLTSIIIPGSVTSIGDCAFYGCSNLTNVKYKGHKTDWEKIEFEKNNDCLQNANIIYACAKMIDNPVEPTCTETGFTEGVHCEICGFIFEKQETIPAGHTIVIDNAVSPSCTKTGLTEGKHCSVCGEIIAAQEVVPALGHKHDTYKTCASCSGKGAITTNSEHQCYSCKGKGSFQYKCSTCSGTGSVTKTVQETATCQICLGEKVTWNLSLRRWVACAFCNGTGTFKHDVTKTYTCSNCRGLGYYGVSCSSCNGKGKEIWTDTSKCTTCNGNGKLEIVGKIIAPSCKEKGYTIYTCSRCGESYKTDYTDKVNSHNYNSVITKQATCTTTGVKTFTCPICNDSYSELIPANGIHSLKSCNNAVAPTCTTVGKESDMKCSICGIKLTTGKTIPAKGHNSISINNAVAPTCTTTGKESDTKCSVCEEFLTLGATITAKGHSYSTKVVKPTYAAKGYTLHTCSVCKKTYKDKYTNKLTVAKPAISKVTSPKSKQIKVTWGKKTYTGYQVQIATDKKFTKNKKSATIKKASTVSTTFTKLKGKTKYYVRVRAYKTYNGKNYYSSWSTVKTVTTKK